MFWIVSIDIAGLRLRWQRWGVKETPAPVYRVIFSSIISTASSFLFRPSFADWYAIRFEEYFPTASAIGAGECSHVHWSSRPTGSPMSSMWLAKLLFSSPNRAHVWNNWQWNWSIPGSGIGLWTLMHAWQAFNVPQSEQCYCSRQCWWIQSCWTPLTPRDTYL